MFSPVHLAPSSEPGLAPADAEALLDAARDLAGAREVEDVTAIVRRAARALTRADGVTFVLREGDRVHYADEDAIAPLWKGSRFPAKACISGWAMEHRTTVVIEDVFADERIPHDLYRSTFVKSLAMVPVRREDPVAAIGAYWAAPHLADARELALLEALAGLAAVALANAALWADLRRALLARDDFLVRASHELRTPLSPLKLRLQSALRRIDTGHPAAEVREAVAFAERDVKRLESIADALLDASRVGERGVELSVEEVDLAEIAGDAASEIEAEGKVRIDVVAGEPVRVVADPRRVAQVFRHLLSNAAKFGGGRPIELRVDEDGGLARASVRDRGVGIPPGDRPRIFHRYERPAPDRHFGGLGLGLWLVREIVQAHGGSVRVESGLGEGTAFTILLPLAPPRAQ